MLIHQNSHITQTVLQQREQNVLLYNTAHCTTRKHIQEAGANLLKSIAILFQVTEDMYRDTDREK